MSPEVPRREPALRARNSIEKSDKASRPIGLSILARLRGALPAETAPRGAPSASEERVFVLEAHHALAVAGDEVDFKVDVALGLEVLQGRHLDRVRDM